MDANLSFSGGENGGDDSDPGGNNLYVVKQEEVETTAGTYPCEEFL